MGDRFLLPINLSRLTSKDLQRSSLLNFNELI